MKITSIIFLLVVSLSCSSKDDISGVWVKQTEPGVFHTILIIKEDSIKIGHELLDDQNEYCTKIDFETRSFKVNNNKIFISPDEVIDYELEDSLLYFDEEFVFFKLDDTLEEKNFKSVFEKGYYRMFNKQQSDTIYFIDNFNYISLSSGFNKYELNISNEGVINLSEHDTWCSFFYLAEVDENGIKILYVDETRSIHEVKFVKIPSYDTLHFDSLWAKKELMSMVKNK